MAQHPSFASVTIGDEAPLLVFGPLTRTDFVRYAGASHDFNPNHHDEVYAKERGNKTVFGVGMLAAGYGGRLMTDWFGVPALRRLRIRFASRFWPGDVLTATGKVTAKNEADGVLECEFTLVNQDGEVIVRGDATVARGR
jgi:peroxisomal enoyl-CoA hydratase 2